MKKETIEEKNTFPAKAEDAETVEMKASEKDLTGNSKEKPLTGENPVEEEITVDSRSIFSDDTSDAPEPVSDSEPEEAAPEEPDQEPEGEETEEPGQEPEPEETATEEPDQEPEPEETATEEPDQEPEPEETATEEPDQEPEEAAAEEHSDKPEQSDQGINAEKTSYEPDKKDSVHLTESVKTEKQTWTRNQPVGSIENSRTGKNSRIAFFVSLLLVIGILGGIYAYGYNYCSTHFMPGTKINGYDCGGLTEEEAEARFAEAAGDYVLNIRFRGGATEIVHAQEMGFAYKPDGSIGALLQQQDKLVWPKYYFEDSIYEIKPGGTIDDEKLTKALQSLPELQEENMEKPKNAYIEFQDGNEKEDGKFVIVPETAGTTIDIVQLAAGVGDAAARYSELVDAEDIGGAYVEASLKQDDAKIVARCDDLNDLVGASITYELPDGSTMRLNSDVMKDWLVKDDSGKLVKKDTVWDEKLWEFLEQLAYNANTIGMDRQFKSTLRGTITVSGGDYGYMVNQVTEHDKLLEDFKKQTKETRKPDYYIAPYNNQTENDGIGNTYIEADLSAQHFWCYIDGQLVVESDFVSGDTTTGHSTPTGVFGIMFMMKDTTLRGVMQSNGKYEYETKVGYWMPFYDGCGFHDAWWRTAFGGTIYKGNGSHGCINLPVEAAQTLYSYCDDNMPVVVYW